VPAGSVLITGAAGFIGLALAARLRASGLRPVGLDLVAPAGAAFPCVVGDVRDPTIMADLIRRHDVAAIVHAGGVSGRSVARDDRLGTIMTNVQGTANVFEAALRGGVGRVVLCSSGSVYGCSTLDPLSEDAPLVPVNAYGASKAGAEAILHAYAAEGGVDGVALRIFNAYGPGRRTGSPMRTMIEAGLGGRVAEVAYSGEARFQFVHVDDVVDALVAALAAPRLPQRAYNVSGGQSLPLREVAGVVAEIIPGFRVRFGEDPFSREYCLREVDLSAAARDLGFAPKIGLREGVAGYAQALRARLGGAELPG
jgi:UDP-glucuronate 4-epimerase